MKGPGAVIAAVVGLWICAVLQLSLSPRLMIGLGSPDFFLILLASLGMFYDRKGVMILGFGGGWLCGAISGVNLTIYVISRCIVGFLLGWMFGMGVQRHYFVAAMAGAGATVLAQLILLFLGAYRGALLPFLAGTLVTSMYDGVIAALLFLLIDRFANPRRQERY